MELLAELEVLELFQYLAPEAVGVLALLELEEELVQQHLVALECSLQGSVEVVA